MPRVKAPCSKLWGYPTEVFYEMAEGGWRAIHQVKKLEGKIRKNLKGLGFDV